MRGASCASLSDLLTRLGGFPKAKKDGTSLATKLVQPLLKLLNEEGSDVWEEALGLLCSIINVFPSSVSRHYDSVEATIVSKIISENVNSSMLKKLSHALALLPKSRGDEDSWLLMMQKILLFLNDQLNDVFQGLEEETSRNEVKKLLLPTGKDPPPPLGGSMVSGKLSALVMRRPEQFLISRISTLLLGCCKMLSNSYPVQVPVPIRPLLAIARRVMKVDGSLSNAYPFITAMNQEFICLDLPMLHIQSLELLTAIVMGLRSQLLPHVADMTRFLTEYFKTCGLPELRVKVYSILKVLLMSMGVGIAIYLFQEIIDNAFIDLDARDQQRISTDSGTYSKASEEAIQHPSRRKRKHPSITGSLGDQSDQGGLEVDRTRNLTPITVRIAALEALEALLTVGGALRSNSWRSSVDHLIMTVATNACRGGWAREKNTFFSGDEAPIWADFQLAALRALLASLLSPGCVRPPHIAQGLDLFRRGTQETGTKIANFCTHALLSLEVLIHPRALPVIDCQSHFDDYAGVGWMETMHSSGHRENAFTAGTAGKKVSPNEAVLDEDDLYCSWLENGDVMEDPLANLQSNVENPEEAPGTSKSPSIVKVTDDFPSGTSNHEANKLQLTAVDANLQMSVDGDDVVVEFQKQGAFMGSEVHNRTKDGYSFTITGDCSATGSDSFSTLQLTTNPASVSGKERETTSAVDKITSPTLGKDVNSSHKDGYSSILENISVSLSNTDSKRAISYKMDDDDSSSEFPDIVDGDPDSD